MNIWEKLTHSISENTINILGAVAILAGGWLLAYLIAAICRKVLERANINRKVTQWVGGHDGGDLQVSTVVSRIIYFVLLLLVLVAFFQTLGLTDVRRAS